MDSVKSLAAQDKWNKDARNWMETLSWNRSTATTNVINEVKADQNRGEDQHRTAADQVRC